MTKTTSMRMMTIRLASEIWIGPTRWT